MKRALYKFGVIICVKRADVRQGKVTRVRKDHWLGGDDEVLVTNNNVTISYVRCLFLPT